MSKVKTSNPVLSSWISLNTKLQTASEKDSESLLNEELLDRRRKQFLLRIHSRINKLRAARERAQLRKQAK